MERLLGFDPQLLFDAFVTGINVFILFFALSYLLFNTVRDVLERRRQKIAGELKSAADDKEAARAMKEVELERKKALDDMKEQIISIASVMAGKVVAASIDTTVSDALIEETLKEMGESTWQS